MIGLNFGSERKRFSTVRFAFRYRFKKLGARAFSTNSPPGTSGHPASAADVKKKGNFSIWLLSAYSIAASIALKAVIRVIVSYVESLSGKEPDPDARKLYCPNPEDSSRSNPIQCKIAV